MLILLLNSLILSSQFYHGAAASPFINIKTNQSKIKFASGDVQALKNIRIVHVTYDYEYMAVCSFTSEQDYLDDLKKNNKEIEANRLINEWKQLPKNVLQPKFEESFNRNTSTIGMELTNNITSNQVTLIVKFLKEDPHYHKKLSSPPYLSLECTFLDAEGYFIARFNIMASGSHENNLTDRFGECYTIAGKLLGKEITKRLRS